MLYCTYQIKYLKQRERDTMANETGWVAPDGYHIYGTQCKINDEGQPSIAIRGPKPSETTQAAAYKGLYCEVFVHLVLF